MLQEWLESTFTANTGYNYNYIKISIVTTASDCIGFSMFGDRKGSQI
jgi:hypothetical protein